MYKTKIGLSFVIVVVIVLNVASCGYMKELYNSKEAQDLIHEVEDQIGRSADSIADSVKDQVSDAVSDTAEQTKGNISKWWNNIITKITGLFSEKELSESDKNLLLLDQFTAAYGGTYWTFNHSAKQNDSYSFMGMGRQCKGFACWIFDILFNIKGNYIGSTVTGGEYNNAQINAAQNTVKQIGSSLNMTVDNNDASEESLKEVKNLFENKDALPGCFIQVRRRKSGGAHSMILYKVDKTAERIYIFECNGGDAEAKTPGGDCKIKLNSYSYSDFIIKNAAVSIYSAYGSNDSLKPAVQYIKYLPMKCTAGDTINTYNSVDCKKSAGNIKTDNTFLITSIIKDENSKYKAKVSYINGTVSAGDPAVEADVITNAWIDLSAVISNTDKNPYTKKIQTDTSVYGSQINADYGLIKKDTDVTVIPGDTKDWLQIIYKIEITDYNGYAVGWIKK